ncbi:MAG TPA: anaerobic sulfite reductase subunit AsrA [Candidatus Rifleibacterium sp.]|nr:anaerobic sulfite reductase subunit AsrA [Candidatus Rifleibacterium sp.]HPT48014.1 anaerobic sulfite reductase subunit AsrA [Candidatus Rifleibacterium sp.]
MNSYELTRSNFAALFAALASRYRIYGPKRFAGKGRFSDTDLIKYAPLAGPDELELSEKSSLSPKSLVFPPDETIFHFNENDFVAPKPADDREIIVLLRPCDINGFARLDKMFLENGGQPDFYYERRRRRLHFFMLECRASFENCFCVSMQANSTDNYAAALRFGDENVQVQLKDERFAGFFAGLGRGSDFCPEFVQENFKQVRVPAVDTMPAEMFTHKLWEEYDSRCIACGRCNTSCVTCSCFSTLDLFYADSRQCGERRRVWDGCHLDGFSDMAGGHSFRKNKGERMRFKAFHKIYDFRRRFGFNMCVGCGRCDDVCPEFISFSSCINKVSDALKGGGKP